MSTWYLRGHLYVKTITKSITLWVRHVHTCYCWLDVVNIPLQKKIRSQYCNWEKTFPVLLIFNSVCVWCPVWGLVFNRLKVSTQDQFSWMFQNMFIRYIWAFIYSYCSTNVKYIPITFKIFVCYWSRLSISKSNNYLSYFPNSLN